MRAARALVTLTFAAGGFFVLSTSGCGIFVLKSDQDTAMATLTAATEKGAEQSRAENAALRADLEATRTRLDNALRSNADNGSDLMSSKARLNDLAGKMDETTHGLEEVRKDVISTRTEVYARIDELKRAQAVQPTPAPPPPQIPADKGPLFSAVEAAYAKKDFTLVRTLGHEYSNRYATDEKTDEVLYFIGDADLQDGRPSSALGEFNRILKLFPKSKVLSKTLFGMGEAYLVLHDCPNAKLAFSACEARFAKEKIGIEAKQRIAKIEKPAPGTCAP